MEFDSPSVTLIGCLMPSVAGSNAKPDWMQNITSSELTYTAIYKLISLLIFTSMYLSETIGGK